MKKLIYTLIFISLLSSCTTMIYTDIDVLRPAKVTFNKDAKNLLILNNSVLQPKTFGHVNQLLNEKRKSVSVDTDSLAIFCLSVLNEEFQKKGFFDNTNLHLTSTNTSGSFLIAASPSPDTIRTLSNYYDSDVILSLDKIKATDYIYEYYNNATNTFYALLEVNFETSWSVNYPNENTTQSYVFKDTIYWDYESYKRKTALSMLPNRYDALIDGALHVGQSVINKLVPWWDKEERYFFATDNKYMKLGIDSVYTKNWKSAISIWNLGTKKASPMLKAKYYHNIATAYEISGDMEKAVENIEKAIDAMNNAAEINYSHYFTITLYEAKLKNRLSEIKLINKQLGVN